MYHTFFLEILNLEFLCLSEPQWPPVHLLCACVDHHSRRAFGKAGKQSGPSGGFDLPRAKLGRRRQPRAALALGWLAQWSMSIWVCTSPPVGTVTCPLVLGPRWWWRGGGGCRGWGLGRRWGCCFRVKMSPSAVSPPTPVLTGEPRKPMVGNM